ncbi:hypothetical protein ACP70R_032771 [Stipagrostis hirtigluma subsp. patula]
MRSKKAAGKRHTSNRRNNDVSRILEVKETSNVAVRNKRGRRASTPSKSVRGRKVDKLINSDDAVDCYIHDTDEGHVGISQSAGIEECVDERTGDVDIAKTGQSGHSSDDQSSASEEQVQSTNSRNAPQKACSQTAEMIPESPDVIEKSFCATKKTDATGSKQDTSNLKEVDTEPAGQNALSNEDGSNVHTAVVKDSIDEERSSQGIDAACDEQMNATSCEDKSSGEVEDVKVCDICGDVGEEEKLAVCSRCNDGAEHIYCMRIMMEEVPESEWLCEDCQAELEFEKENKLAKCQVKFGTSEEQSSGGKMNKSVNVAKSRSSSDSEVETEKVGNKESDTANEGNNMINNRMEEDAAVASSGRETVPEPSMGPDSRKRMPPSRESSFKFDTDKGKQPNHEVATSLAPNTLKNQAPQPRGQLSKSTSFNNSKVPKVKQLLIEVPHKPKNLKEPWSSIIKKEGAISMTTKSATFKKPKYCEPAIMTKSSILSPAEEQRAMNLPVSQSVTNDRGTSILGCPSATASIVGTVPSKVDTTAQHLLIGNDKADSNDSSIVHRLGGKNIPGNSELNKLLLANVPGNTMLSSGEKNSGIKGSGAQRQTIQNSDPTYWDNKIKDPPSFRSGASGSNQTIRCQRCNEAGHSTQFCTGDKLRLSAVKLWSERNLKDVSIYRNKTLETGTLVATEKAVSRSAVQSEQILKFGLYQNPICGPKDALSALFNHVKKPSPLVVRTDEQHMRYSMSTPGSATSIDSRKLKLKDDHPKSATIGRSVVNGFTVPSDLRDKSCQGFSTGDESIALTVPELNYIWQGGFELQRTGKSPELFDGFQAHLSCSATQLVLEVAKKFPSKVQLEELPRHSSWPTQFQKSGPTYDNVGLFFFARDAQSYENHYSKLVENMLKNDLVLRGSVGTAELLIFPSNTLSKNFQRWNMFYFLWGVFKVSRPTSTREPNLSEGPQTVDPTTSVPSSSRLFSKDTNNLFKPDPNLVKSATCTDLRYPESLEANHQGCLNGENSLNQPMSRRPLVDHCDSVTAKCLTSNNGSINHSTATERKHEKIDYSGHKDKMRGTFDAIVGERYFDVNKVPVACSVSLIHEKETGKESTMINLDNAEDPMVIDMDIDDESTSEVITGALDPFSHASSGAHKRNFEMANGSGEVNGALEHKKIKLDNIV